jgi:hypothetical protein
MQKELNYLASKKWEKVGRQELRSTPYKQEIDPWSQPVLFFWKHLLLRHASREEKTVERK